MSEYVKPTTIAEKYELSVDWFMYRIKNGTFKKGIHYLQPEVNGAIRWCVEEIDRYFRGEVQPVEHSSHSKLINNLLK